MKFRLSPHFETMFLLLNAEWGKEQKKEVVEEINAIGLNGAAFYKANFAVVERYYSAFQSCRVDSPGIAFIADFNKEVLAVFINLFWRQPHWFTEIEDIPEEVVFEAVKQAIAILD